jgi:RNA polymerase-binding transcription factor DksA
MEELRQRLELELSRTVERSRQLGGELVFEHAPAVMGENFTLADTADVGRVNEDREMSFATRSRLVEKARELAGALERLRKGSYGVCQECGGLIGARRLQAIPEVTTCVGCQDRIERLSRRLARVGSAFAGDLGRAG